MASGCTSVSLSNDYKSVFSVHSEVPSRGVGCFDLIGPMNLCGASSPVAPRSAYALVKEHRLQEPVTRLEIYPGWCGQKNRMTPEGVSYHRPYLSIGEYKDGATVPSFRFM